jgi:hypothetical protein
MKPNKNWSAAFSIKIIIFFVGVFGLLVTQSRAASERAEADVVCDETGKPLQYSCIIEMHERNSDKPVTGAKIVINADMPDMPMAHNVPPVVAMESETPGVYQATLLLEMRGSWVLRLSVSGPIRDIVVVTMEFGPHTDHEQAPHEHH